jgi:hypothetical protein
VYAYSFDFFKVAVQNNNNYSCTSKSSISAITTALVSGTTTSTRCNGHTYKTFKCSGSINFCVDCSETCSNVTSCPSSGQMSLNPCLSCSQTTTGSFIIIGLTYAESISYPVILTPIYVTAGKRQMTVTVNIYNNTGKVYCAALATGTSVTSTVIVQQNGTSATVRSSGNVSVTISNLVPSSTYDIYCYTQDFSNHVMPLATVLTTKTARTTLCCRSVAFSKLSTKLIAATTYSSSTSVNIVQLEALPSTKLMMSLSLTSYSCSWQVDGTTSLAYAVPSTSNFTSASTTASMSFIILGTPGCYILSSLVAGPDKSTYSNVNSTIIVRSSATAPDPPKLLSAMFSNDGLKLTMTLDSVSDRGATTIATYLSTFTCSQLLTFTGASSSNCVWYSSSVIIATISSSTATSLVTVGSNVTLQRNKIKAVCSSGLTCGFANASSVIVVAPTSAIVPTVQIVTATKIGGCDNIVIDPTASTGYGGRKWQSVTWSVSGVGTKIYSRNLSTIAAYLTGNYTSTSSLVTVHNSLLAYGTYTIGLTLTNFLGKSGFGQVSITVSDSQVIPRLSIVGSGSINMYRYQTLSVFANASFPACLKESVSLAYTWSLFQSSSLQYSIVSYAKDPRFYRLAAYSMAASTSYLLRISVASLSTPTVSLTTAQITVNVGSSGVTATISGGAVQTFGVGSTMVLDASGSQDIDYPTNSLSYQWSCMEISPYFGDDCKNFTGATTNASALSILSSTLTEDVSQTELSLTVYVSNSDGFSASASVSAILLQVLTPVLSIQAASVVNVNDAITVTGLIYSTLPLTTTWSVIDSNLTLSSISSNNKISRSFTSVGYNAFDLGIVANSLVAGLSYTFQLSAQYVGFSVAAYAQITITINSPPSGGSISVTPSSGYAATTAFFMVTADWVDDASDYPFSYVFSYYTTTSANTVVVKSLDSKSYTTAVLGQGLLANNYYVTCVAEVLNAFNGSSSLTTTVIVNPLANVSALATQTSASMAAALSSYDPSAVSQIIGATTNAVNAANCSMSVSCWSLHRENCSFTALTCGPCLSGYIGVSGDSNVACFSESNPPSTVTCTAADASSVCESGKCDDSNVCVEPDKTCTNNCSYAVNSNGLCVFYDVNNVETASCAQSDSYCRAACVCNDGFYGSDCSLSLDELGTMQSIRDTLCLGLYETLSIQDVSSDVVISRATSIANILIDSSQLSDDGFSNCTAALVGTIQSDPEIAGSASTASLCMTALSTVLQKGSSLSSDLVTNISSAVTTLNNGIQSRMAVGQQTVELTTANVRMSTSLQTASDIDGSTFSPPLTTYEKYLGANTSSLGVNMSAAGIDSNSAVGVSVMQYTSNPHGKVTNSRSTGLSLSAYSAGTVSSTSRRRRLATSGSVGVTIVLDNIDSEEYYSYEAYNSTVFCEETGSSYNLTVVCPVVNQTVACTGLATGYVNVTCPAVSYLPQCNIWDGSSYTTSSSCTVSDYTATTTTCLCFTSSPDSVDQGDLAVSELQEFAASAELVIGNFVDTFTSVTQLSLSSITHNAIIFSLVVSIFCASVVGVVVAVQVDMRELGSRTKHLKESAQNVVVYNFEEFLLSSRPEELSDAPWHVKLWRKLVSEHEWVSMFSGYHSITDYRSRKFIIVVGLIINFLFCDTILSVLFFYDDGTCGTYTAESNCLSQMSLDELETLCVWDSSTSTCSFNDHVGQTFLSTLILTGIITAFSIPFQIFYESMVNAIREFFCVVYIKRLKETGIDDGFRVDFENLQTKRGRWMRAARLLKMQTLMDKVTVEEEAEILQSQIEYDLNRPVYELVGIQSTIPVKYDSPGKGGDADAADEVVKVDGVDSIENDPQQPATESTREIQQMRKVQHRWVSNLRGVVAKSLLSHHFTNMETVEELKGKIEVARRQEQEIVGVLENATSVGARNKILLQQFCANLLSGFRKDVALKFFEYSARESSHSKKIGWYHYFSLVMFPCYLVGTCFYIFLFGVKLGANNTNNWLLGGLVSIAEDIFLLIPLKLYLKWIVMSTLIIADIKEIYHHLQSKVGLIMRRSSGFMKSANGMVHHLNPACRAARKYPGLAVSRLLMSVTDDDLPRNLAHPQAVSLTRGAKFAGLAVVLGIAMLPDLVQTIIFETCAVCAVGGVLIIFAQLGTISIAIPIVLAVVMIVCPIVFFIVTAQRKAQSSVHITINPAFDSEVSGVHDPESPKTSEAIALGSPAPPVVSVDWKSLMGNLEDIEDATPTKEQQRGLSSRSDSSSAFDESSVKSQNFPRKKHRQGKDAAGVIYPADSPTNSNKRKPDVTMFEYDDFIDYISKYDKGTNDYSFYGNPLSGDTSRPAPPASYRTIDRRVSDTRSPSYQPVAEEDSVSYDLYPAREPGYVSVSPSMQSSAGRAVPNTAPVRLRGQSPEVGAASGDMEPRFSMGVSSSRSASPKAGSFRKRSQSPVVRRAPRSGVSALARGQGHAAPVTSPFKPLDPSTLSSPPSSTGASNSPEGRTPRQPVHHSLSFYELLGIDDNELDLSAIAPGEAVGRPSSSSSISDATTQSIVAAAKPEVAQSVVIGQSTFCLLVSSMLSNSAIISRCF